ncbi:hypothetical protein COL154_005727 [Colletotrichum chrysophilum]|uniref:ABM domain-containing protein n=1 Tax=Colletotrichum chrysophilum TaxID=1836956 RepID=A0AAD9EHD0_9PEZI|nr:uncharacterized protein COL26b_003853 [Colletotrichum chrysophilum]KAF4878945.1 hypothetical protein CGCSCA1_v001515 [Colletotrichum siamense]KAI8256198.1 hypothetical protein K4K53_007406 [Colletotrichum sp. SAR 10_77]KAJ0345444.1 hypothetical protein KNSL1_008435 [Colletotrichum chrysophilum]KAJ0363108.1 hypothetical protein COL154_005727 [Colletotrichum chrysophilum]KAJ0377935.1 hypothetical protein COL26b_003853 [Colletotrichum chrysophilum]
MDPAAAQLANAVTERVIIPVKGGIDDWKEQLKSMLQVLQNQPGYLRTRWGPWSEDPQKLELLAGWINAEASEAWKRTRDYADAMAKLAPVLSGQPTSYLLQFKPFAPQAVINSPIVETLSFEGCREPEERMREIVERAKAMPGCNGVASGFSLCRNSSGGGPSSSSSGGMASGSASIGGGNGGRTFVAVIGWTGVEASRRANKAAYTGGMKTESHHVNFTFPVKGFGGL